MPIKTFIKPGDNLVSDLSGALYTVARVEREDVYLRNIAGAITSFSKMFVLDFMSFSAGQSTTKPEPEPGPKPQPKVGDRYETPLRLTYVVTEIHNTDGTVRIRRLSGGWCTTVFARDIASWTKLAKEPSVVFDPKKPTRTKAGREVRIVCTDAGGDYPLIALDVLNGSVARYTEDGRIFSGSNSSGDLENYTRAVTKKYMMVLSHTDGLLLHKSGAGLGFRHPPKDSLEITVCNGKITAISGWKKED